MSGIVLLRPEAEQDLTAAHGWYERKTAGLGDQFLDEFALAMQSLERDPKRERLYYLNFRRVIVRRFPYKIFYQVFERRVVVFRILHGRQAHEHRIEEPH